MRERGISPPTFFSLFPQALINPSRTAFRNSNIIRLHFGPRNLYLVTKSHNIQSLFRPTAAVDTTMFMLLIQANLQALSPSDLARFRNDKSGRQSSHDQKTPPPPDRYWATLHHIMTAHLSRASQANALAVKFQRELAAQLQRRYPLGEWVAARPYAFARTEMALAATTTLVGERFLQVNPGFLDALWEFDHVAASIVWGLPRWLNRAAYAKRDRFIGMCGRWLKEGEGFDWEGEEADRDWEPAMGSRYARELVRYFRGMGFEERSIAGAMSNLVVFA